MAEILAMVLHKGANYRVDTFTDPRRFLSAFAEDPYDLVVSDLKMPHLSGVDVLERVRAQEPRLPVILITAHATVDTAIAAMRKGAFDYLRKPVDNGELRALVQRALDLNRLTRENRYLRSELQSRYSMDGAIAESQGMQDVFDLARRAARSGSTVLVSGESGTGKELVARAVHYHSDRVGGPFVAVNCKAFASGVLESELFGHERGAFTGAGRARAGLFERARGGTAFLDEIGEIDLDFQAKLLRVVQEREVRRVGGDRDVAVDVRIVAATNRNLVAEVEAGRFREDLFFRLSVIPIHIPPLRERREDILPLARLFLSRECDAQGRGGLTWAEDTEAFLASHDWPGNVRELENAIERGVVLARGDQIDLDDLLLGPRTRPPGRTDGAGPSATLQEAMDAAARDQIRAALQRSGGRRVEAARELGVERTTLYRLMRRLGITTTGAD